MQSWTSSNILNVHKGKVILKKNLISNTFDTLSSIVMHLIQSGSPIDLDYDIIMISLIILLIFKLEIRIAIKLVSVSVVIITS